MDMSFNTLLAVCILPELISVIAQKEGIDEFTALNDFYHSRVYELLADEETKVWHYSALTLYMMYKSEKETGEILFPEEAG